MISLQRTVLFILLCFSFKANAGKVDKAFEALSVYDYFKAKTNFYKSLKKDSVPSSYGLSLIYGRNDNPFHQIDSARKYVLIARRLYPSLEQKEREELLAFELDSMAIEQWKDTVDWKAYFKATRKNNIASYDRYIGLHPDGKWSDKARFKRDSIALEEKKSLNTSVAFKAFLDFYPNSSLYAQAKNRYEQALFEELTAKNSLEAYEQFLIEQQQSPYLSKVEDSIYALSTRSKGLEAYYQFIQKHPNNRNKERAWRKLYTLYTINNQPERIVEFRLDYPDYPFIDELVQDFTLATTTFFPFVKEGKWGFVDKGGKVMINPEYDYVGPFKEGLAVAFKGDYLGYINKSNEAIIPFEYDDGEDFVQGIASVLKGDYLGILNKLNQTLVPFEYDVIGSLDGDLILIAKGDDYGYCNRKGEVIIELKYEKAYDFHNGFAVVVDSGKYGLIDRNANYIVPPVYHWLAPKTELNLLRAKRDSLYGLINTSGEELLGFNYDLINEANDSLFLIVQKDKYGFANASGEIQIPLDFDYTPAIGIGGNFYNGFAKYHLKGKYGIMNYKGEKLFPAIFEDLGEFNDSSWIAVKKRGKWGYSNQQLQLVIPYRYELANSFVGEKAWCKKSGKWTSIDKEGKANTDTSFDQVDKLGSNYYLVKKEAKWGLMDKRGEWLIAPEFDRHQDYGEDWLRFIRNNKVTYFNRQTKEVLEF